MHVFVLQEVPHIMIKKTSFGHLKCWLLWNLNKKLILILADVGHKMILLDQANVQDFRYSLRAIPDRIGISGEATNFVCVCHY